MIFFFLKTEANAVKTGVTPRLSIKLTTVETALRPDLSKQWTDELVRSVSYFRSY